jgi:hypothetical protein
MNLTGKEIVKQLAQGAIKDDVKGSVRQIIKQGGEAQLNRDYASVVKYADHVQEVLTAKGRVRTAELPDGTKVSARSFSLAGRPSIQVNDPSSNQIVKVRYGQ